MQNHFISVTTIYPAALIEQPPIIFVHGSANSAKVWHFWQKEIADLGWTEVDPENWTVSVLDFKHFAGI